MRHPRLGACSWSLRPADPAALVKSLQALDIGTVQLELNAVAEGRPPWQGAIDQLRRAGLRVASGMMRMAGEDYATLQSIARTGGVRPEGTWPANRRAAEAIASLAAGEGIGLVTFHGGFLPHDRRDPVRRVMLDRLGELADLFADRGVEVGLETGQEAADTLLEVLGELDHANVGVNFDPANMILYGTGDPVAALERLAPHVRQVHVKDALPAAAPGAWGTEVPAGRGAVDWAGFFEVALGVDPPLSFIIEREAGGDRHADLVAARDLIAGYLQAAESRMP